MEVLMEYGEFAGALGAGLHLTEDKLEPWIRLEADLGLDSLQYVEVAVVLWEMGMEVEDLPWAHIETVGELWQHFLIFEADRIRNAL